MKRVRRSKETARSQRRDENDEHDPFPMIPWELKKEILLKLRAKDITKLIFVSKQFSSTVLSKAFMDLFLSQSLSRPRFLCVFERRDNRMVFHSSSQEDPSSGHHRIVSSITPYPLAHSNKAPPVHGLMCFQIDTRVMICNPSTGQFITLPEITGRTFFGYDPVNDVYKVLCMTVKKKNVPNKVREYHVFALGAQKAWRMIKCKHSQRLLSSNEICKNGVVYYLAYTKGKKSIIGFDLGSEDFNVIKLPEGSLSLRCNLVEYKGNIALYCRSKDDRSPSLWVLEDANKQEWLNVNISYPSLVDLFQNFSLDFRGAISTGELIFAPTLFTNSYYIRCYDLKKNSERRVEIKGLEVCSPAGQGNFGKVFLDHLESPMFLSKKLIS